MAIARRIQNQGQLHGFLGSRPGKELLKAYSLRRGFEPTQRLNEWGAGYPISLHVAGRHGFLKPSGWIGINNGRLNVEFSSHALAHDRASATRRDSLLNFATSLANRCGLRLRVQQ
ncbi:hypothetical protein HY571_02745 [Candidatus Micrarchaeota archaeon]|nr:hypothetical protein [Candidatus Micrarchaeota archaeon]